MTDSAARLPNFLVIGAQRCATSWLYYCLKDHPQIFMPYVKEVKYFNRRYQEGLEWYERYFKLWKDELVGGEISPSYMYTKEAAPRIRQLLPDAKLLAVLRNPVDRAFSQYMKHISSGSVNWTFEEAIEKNPQYLDRGKYYSQLREYEDYFKKGQLKVLLYEDIKKDSDAFLKSVFEFLGVDEDFRSDKKDKILSHKENVSSYTPLWKITKSLRSIGAGKIVDAVKKSPLLPVIDKTLDWYGRVTPKKEQATIQEKVSIKPATRKKLLDYYRPKNERLQDWSGVDLGRWGK